MVVSSTRAQSRLIVAGAIAFVLCTLFYFRSSLHIQEHVDSIQEHVDAWRPHGAKEEVASKPPDSLISSPAPPVRPLPDLYTARPKQDAFCAALFSPAYLYNLSRNRTSYCDPKQSTSTLECFSTHISGKQPDTFCIASNVAFNRRDKKFYLDCASELEAPYKNFKEYMMWTGLNYVFKEHVVLKEPEMLQKSKKAKIVEEEGGKRRNKKFGVIARREGSGSPHGSAANTWHNLMELMSYYLTLDALSIITSPHAEDNGAAYYNQQLDKANTQVIVVDGHKKGPYFDLWDLFSDPSRNPTLKLSEDKHEAGEQEELEYLDRVIMPLPGASNPFWEGTWTPHHCSQSDLGKVFSSRVLTHYNATDTGVPSLEETAMDLTALPPKWPKKTSDSPLNVLIVKRPKTRRIDNLAAKLAVLEKMFPQVNFNVHDLGAYTFAEQVRLVHTHQILVGVHGAAMTHLLFLPQPPDNPSSTVVEILPHKLGHRGYRNLALMMGHRYISVHADNDMEGKDFHELDLEVEMGKYVDAVATAVKASFHRGMQEMDIETVKTG